MTDSMEYEGRDLEVLADCPRYYSWIVDAMAPHLAGSVIEYGAGVGTISSMLRPLADRLTLVEPSPNLADRLIARFDGDDQVSIHAEPLESHVAKLVDASVDCVAMVNVLEHIEDDAAALCQIQRVLKPGGRLLIFVPALQALMSDLDRRHGHFRRYHLAPLVAVCAEAGLTVEQARYWDFPGMIAWWLFNTIGRSTTFNPKMIEIFDRFVVPVTRRVEAFITLPAGKNIFLVARKPA